MLDSVLIANRGEIARRIIRTARRLGVRTIAVYSDADARAPHVQEADSAERIGPGPAAESYLDFQRVLAAAQRSGARAVHPGYGFLSENPDFAEAVIAAGLIWIGPSPAAIRAMGLKDEAKRLMAQAGVPVTPGWQGEDQSDARLQAEAAALGWPLLIKAIAGGGGKGIRLSETPEDFAGALAAARREARAAFGDDRVLLEKLIASPRHLEVQIFGDQHGEVVHLFERDCTVQRRRQKVLEEAPAPGMDPATREVLCAAAIQAAKAVGYVGAGTVEFIADASEGLRPDRIWFMEMNTRLQVEHPVTEAITGLDLVEWQLRIASGEPLPLAQPDIGMQGWAVEARLCAEDPDRGFLPQVGRIEHLALPGDVRVDSGVIAGGEVSPFYDSMVAKIIAHGADRDAARARLIQALESVELWPLRGNAAFLARCVAHDQFAAGTMHTGFVDGNLDELTAAGPAPVAAESLAALLRGEPDWGQDRAQDRPQVWSPLSGARGFRLNARPDARARLYVDGKPHWAAADPDATPAALHRDGDDRILFDKGRPYRLSLHRLIDADGSGGLMDGAVNTPMPGKIAALLVQVGDRVARGQVLAVLEAMKMEHPLTAPADGRVAEVRVEAGAMVAEAVTVVRLVAEDGEAA